MKRLLFPILLFLLIPVLSFSQSFDESCLIGIWTRSYKPYGSKISTTLYQFYDNHTVLYLSQSYDSNDFENNAFSNLFNWRCIDNKVQIYYGDNVTKELYYIDDSCLSTLPPEKYSLGKHACYTKASIVPEELPTEEDPPATVENDSVIIPVDEQFDFSALSYDELISFRDQLNLAIWNSQEWQEVTVPAGVWTVGEDIPVGHWSISLSPDTKASCGVVKYCDLLNEAKTDAGNQFYCKIYAYIDIGNEDNDRYPQKIDLDLQPGTYIIISHAPVVFTPYSGKPDLGFK